MSWLLPKGMFKVSIIDPSGFEPNLGKLLRILLNKETFVNSWFCSILFLKCLVIKREDLFWILININSSYKLSAITYDRFD